MCLGTVALVGLPSKWRRTHKTVTQISAAAMIRSYFRTFYVNVSGDTFQRQNPSRRGFYANTPNPIQPRD